MPETRKVQLNQTVGGFKDPHVFPYIVKGFRMHDQDLVYESRRTMTEALQTVDRYVAEGRSAYVFLATLSKQVEVA